MRRVLMSIALAGALAGVAGSPVTLAARKATAEEPDHVTVQHILIAFGRSIPGREIERSKEEAESLARELLARARAGEDFAGLVKEYSDDQFPGIYKLANRGVKPEPGERRRYDMVTYFGNVAFGLQVGEVGLAEHHPTRCPYGWHVIKRLE
jgi:hypothetical protein